MIVPDSLSINMEVVLKCKLGHLVLTDFSKFKQFIFPSTRLSCNNRVLTLSKYIGYDFERLVFTGAWVGEGVEFDIIFLTNAHYSTC